MSEAQNDPKVVHLREATQPAQQVVVDANFFDQVVRATTQQVEARSRYVSPFNLNTMDEIVLFAEHTAKSGLCPKAYRDKPNDIISAVIFGKEVGLSAMSSLTSIAMIEGQPQLWGPAVAGVCLQTGQVADHTYAWEGEGAELTAICTVTRKGFSPVEGRFSKADAQLAGLLGRAKDGMPWKAYERDMLMWKASHRAWRQAFPDIIKGLSGEPPPSQEPGLEGWPMPRPEVRWRAMRPKLDDWDPKWFNDACEKLRLAPDSRAWMITLAELLEQAPSLRDVDELDNWDMTTTVVGMIPPDKQHWRLAVEERFGEARKRFIQTEKPADPAADPEPPKTEAKVRRRVAGQNPAQPGETPPPPQETPAGDGYRAVKEGELFAPGRLFRMNQATGLTEVYEPPQQATATTTETTTGTTETTEASGFDWPLFDQIGETIGETTYEQPVAWAKAFIALWEKTGPDMRGALEEHNADAIDAAVEASEEAAAILGDTEAPALEVVALQVIRGKADTIGYLRDLKNHMATLTSEDFNRWVDLQRPTIMGAAASTKLSAMKVIALKATELGLPAPGGWDKPPSNGAAPMSAVAGAGHEESKDGEIERRIIEHLDTLNTVAEIQAYSNTAAVKVPRDRWQREAPARVTTIDSAFQGRIETVSVR